jgi:hypothetical protein
MFGVVIAVPAVEVHDALAITGGHREKPEVSFKERAKRRWFVP